MKKIFTLVAALAVSAGLFTAQAKTVTVTTTSELTNALNGVGNAVGSVDSILVIPAGGESDVLTFSNTSCSWLAGTIYLIGATDYQPKINIRHQAASDTEGELSLICENLSLRYTSGNTASSGQIFYFTGYYTEIDSLIFRNCEFTDYPRTVIRFVPPVDHYEHISSTDSTAVYADGGYINYFEMSGCTIHDANIMSGNNWPIIYFGSMPYEIVFRNNTFYDLPYLKQIFSMNYINDETGRGDCEFTFENNSVLVGTSGGYTAFSIGSYLGQASIYTINNNLFLVPDYSYTDGSGNVLGTEDSPYSTSSTILSASYGLVTATNNVIEGYKPWSAGNQKDDDGEYTWLATDTTGNYTMEDVSLAWDDFFDRESRTFSLLKSDPIYTAGTDGTFIGAESMYVDEFDATAAVNVSVSGSSFASVTISPEQSIYFVGDEITLSVDLHEGLATFTGWSDGVTDMTRTVVLEGDLDLVANVVSEDFELVWDFDVITKNNQALTIPLAADHAASEENPGSFGVMTVEHSEDGVTYADTLACDSRNNKSYPYNGEDAVTFPAALVRVTLNADSVEAQVLAQTGMSAEDLAATNGTENETYAYLTSGCCPYPDYTYITFSTKGMSGITVSSVILSEARNFSVTNLEWSLDNVTYETLNSVQIDALGTAWLDLNATLPSGADDQEIVYVRWIGDNNYPIIGAGMSGTTDNHLRCYNTYMFIGNIKVVAEEGGAAVEEIEAALPVAFSIAQSGNQVTVSGADAATVELFAANGALVASTPVVEGQATLTIPGRGVYYVRAGKEAKAVIF
ncbi:MAG: hypothetical protein LUI04_02325 [Porphyromonadaceae bacterium]|nr:hypothetical protein [Porphyromonadaceae bacterium]